MDAKEIKEFRTENWGNDNVVIVAILDNGLEIYVAKCTRPLDEKAINDFLNDWEEPILSMANHPDDNYGLLFWGCDYDGDEQTRQHGRYLKMGIDIP